MNKKRIVFLSPSLVFYGAENSLYLLVKNLDREKFCPIIIVPDGCDYKDKFDKIGVEIEEVNFVNRFNLSNTNKILKANFQIINIIKRNNATLIHVNLTSHIESLFLAFFYVLFTRKKVIFHIRTHSRFSMIERFFIFRGYAICVSKAIKNQLLKKRTSDFLSRPYKERVIQIYNGRELNKFINQNNTDYLKNEFNLNGQKIIGIVSAIDEKKRIELFLSIAKEIKASLTNVRFIIVGDIYSDHPKHIAYRERMMNLARKLCIENDVIFTGRRDNIQDFYALFDVFVLTSSREPLGGVIIEAMAAAKPVVSSAVDGSVELIVDKVTGFLINSSNPYDYATKIINLLWDAHLCEKMGEAGRKRAIEFFEIKRHVFQIENLYNSILGE